MSAYIFTLSLPPFTAGEDAENDVLTSLNAAVDLNGISILGTGGASRGINTELLDAIQANPQPDQCPLIRLNTWTDTETTAVGGGRYRTPYTMSLYVVYYYGVPSVDEIWPIDYTTQRWRHLQAIDAALRMESGGNSGAPLSAAHGWKWVSGAGSVIRDYGSPFKYLDNQYQMSNGFECVRIDRKLEVYQ